MQEIKRRTLMLLLMLLLAGLTPLRWLWHLVLILSGSARAWRALVAEDQLWASFFPAVLHGLTLSSYAGQARVEGRGWANVVCRLLDVIDENHVQESMRADYERALAVVQALEPRAQAN